MSKSPRVWFNLVAAVVLSLGIARPGRAATYYVSPSGSDSNPGSLALPWLTIQKAANTMLADDTAIVLAGSYPERVVTARGGTAETNRITFKASGVATMKGFAINHAYVTVDGFDITGHSAADRFIGYIVVNAANFKVLNNTIRDGVSIIRPDLVFSNNGTLSDTISSATGGFLAAGFLSGMAVSVLRATNNTLLNVNAGATILSVTDNVITLAVTNSLINEGPISAYLNASINFGVVVRSSSAKFGLVQSNHFSNLDYHACLIGGNSNVYEYNTFEGNNGWGVMYFAGTSNTVRRNVIRNGTVKGLPDANAFATFSGPTFAIAFEENFIQGFIGILGFIAGPPTDMHDLVFRRNVFVTVGPFLNRVPNVSFLNNTFHRVAEGPMPGVAVSPHPIALLSSGTQSANGAVLKNNIFVGCGNQPQTSPSNGWYGASAGVTNYVADYNFVCGPAADFNAKLGFNEVHGLNGGDPGFVNINDPFGPDGISFTADDGLRLLSNSMLRGQGEAGVDLGAYVTASADFNASPTNGVAPLTVTFTDTSTGANTNWSWDFGDGHTSGDRNPGHTYSNAGVYTVSLTVNGDDGTSTFARTNLIVVLTPFEDWQLQYFGCINCPESSAESDFDGDGVSNLKEFIAGSDPTNSTSALRIISVVREGADVNVTWQTAGGRTNVVQATAGGLTGGYTSNYIDISSAIVIPGNGQTTTNYVDISGSTNGPSRYYRVRLVP